MKKPPRKRAVAAQRGFTLAELCTVLAMVVFFFIIAIAILNPLTRAATQGQAKLETVQTPTQGFYVIQRDLRMGHATSTFDCDTAATTCQTAWDSGHPVIAIPTATNGSGNMQVSSGVPNWQGFVVYWASGGKLYRSYQSGTASTTAPSSAAALTAVTNANPSSPAAADTFLVGDYTLSISQSGNATSLQMIARSTYGGSTNQTTYTSNVIPEN